MNKLLIVDDEEIEINAFKIMVGKAIKNLTIISADNGIDAIEIAKNEKPDIIFMDIEMPGINGLEVIDLIKKMLPNSRAIVHTAHSNFQYAQTGIQVGAVDYLLKPVEMNLLIRTVKKNIEIFNEQRCRFNEFQQLNEQLTKLQPFIEKDIIFSVINGAEGQSMLKQYASLLNIKINKAFCVIFKVIKIKTNDNLYETSLADKHHIASIIVDTLKHECQCIASEYINGYVLAAIPYENDTQKFDFRIWSIDLAKRVYNRCKKFGEIIVGIGGLSSQFENIYISLTWKRIRFWTMIPPIIELHILTI